jgi:glucose dehydrogenase
VLSCSALAAGVRPCLLGVWPVQTKTSTRCRGTRGIWVMQAGNYANHRDSQLKQITSDNVSKLQVAWTFSTGALRGHEGGPLVIGDIMYLHGPFANPVFALDLNNDGRLFENTSQSKIRTWSPLCAAVPAIAAWPMASRALKVVDRIAPYQQCERRQSVARKRHLRPPI